MMSAREPLLRRHREANYQAQNGSTKLTPAQRRRARKKANRLNRKRGESA